MSYGTGEQAQQLGSCYDACENSSHRKTPLLNCLTRQFCILTGKRKQEDLSTSNTQLFYNMKIALALLEENNFLKDDCGLLLVKKSSLLLCCFSTDF